MSNRNGCRGTALRAVAVGLQLVQDLLGRGLLALEALRQRWRVFGRPLVFGSRRVRAERRFQLVVAAADGVSEAERISREVFGGLLGLRLGRRQMRIWAQLAPFAGLLENGNRRLASSAVVSHYRHPVG